MTLDYSATLSQAGNLTVHNGVNHFNGEQALAFARERYAYSDGDRQRGRNQMMIMEAAIKKLVLQQLYQIIHLYYQKCLKCNYRYEL